MKIYVSEILGTFLLVFIGTCSIAIGGFDSGAEIGRLGIGLSFGFALIAAIYSFDSISGAHFNPSVTFGFFCAGKLSFKKMIFYFMSQFIGAILATFFLWTILRHHAFDTHEVINFGANGWDTTKYATLKVFLTEMLATFFFVLVIFRTHQRNVGGLVIGIMLAVLHFSLIPISGNSLNPARSFGPALFSGKEAIGQVWLYLTAPMIGGALAGFLSIFFKGKEN